MPAAVAMRKYGVLVPVKPPDAAKSRLGPLGDSVRRDLATAFAADTVAAALECPTVACVLVVTDDHVLAAGLRELGAEVIPDGASDDLNESLVQAAAELRRRHPEMPIAALCADLPSLRPDQLTAVLRDAPADRTSFVADSDGTGTTLLLAPDLVSFTPRFGPQSRQAHLDAGAEEIDRRDVPTLRHDVDEPADLAEALRIGVGPRTSLVAAGLATTL
jgi:2-phospho-L-lactate/phosphoenolpyruvate guanylyltransferase